MSSLRKRVFQGWLISLAVLAAVLPFGAMARHYHGHGGCYHCYYHHHHHHSGRWVAGAVLAGATAGMVSSAMTHHYSEGPRYVEAPVVYATPVPTTTVIYEGVPASRTVTTTTTTTYYTQ